MPKETYDKRKALEAENALIREENDNARLKLDADRLKIDSVAAKAFLAILEGTAALVISEGHDVGSKIVSFQMPKG